MPSIRSESDCSTIDAAEDRPFAFDVVHVIDDKNAQDNVSQTSTTDSDCPCHHHHHYYRNRRGPIDENPIDVDIPISTLPESQSPRDPRGKEPTYLPPRNGIIRLAHLSEPVKLGPSRVHTAFCLFSTIIILFIIMLLYFCPFLRHYVVPPWGF